MAKAELKSTVDVNITIELKLTLAEAKALNEITGYGADPFLEGYYKQLGKSYLQPHEKGVRSLFKTIKEVLPYKIHDADNLIDHIKKIDAKSINGIININAPIK